MGWFGFGEKIEMNADGSFKKEKKQSKQPAKKKVSKEGRTAKEEKMVKMFLAYASDMKYEYADVEKLLTSRENKAIITMLNRIIKKLEK